MPDSAWRNALVTGASSGIGEAFARLLAAQGADLVLVARRRDRLEEIAADLRSAHGANVDVMAADLAEPGDLRGVEQRLAGDGDSIDLVVNSAGFGTHGQFAALPVDEEEREIRVNVVAPVRLSRAALPAMLARRAGGIVNVSSLAGQLPIPFWATYAATKAYLTSFSIALHEEVKSGGVRVLALMPGFTRTEFQTRRRELGMAQVPAAAWMAAEDVAISGLRAIDRGEAACVPGLHYKLLNVLLRTTPWSISRRLARETGQRLQTD